MVNLSVEGDTLHLEVQGWDKLWAMKSRLEIPLVHISDVHAEPNPPMGWFQGLKMGGTDLPNVFRAGTFYQDGEWVFWDVRNKENTIAISLHDERYKKLIIEVEDPHVAVQQIREGLERHQANVVAAHAELDAVL